MPKPQIHPGPVLTRKLLESTLPWTIRIQFLNDNGDLVFDWNPDLKIRRWLDVIHLSFGPKDLYFEE